jgi:hypothetical protein
MKLMYFLMDRDEQREKRLELEFEVGPSVRRAAADRSSARAMHGWSTPLLGWQWRFI